MSLEDFQFLDIEPFDNSIVKRDFLKVYHQQGVQINQSDQQPEFVFGENKNYHQIGKSYLEFNLTVRRNDNADFDNDSAIRLTNNGLAYVFEEARLSITVVSDLENNEFVGQISTIMRCMTSKDLVSQFDKINEGEIAAEIQDKIKSSSLKKMLLKDHNIVRQEVNRGKIKGQLPLEYIFGFCKIFTPKSLVFV